MIFSPSTLLGDGPLWQTLFEDGHGRSLGELHCQMDPVLPGVVIRFVCYDDVFAFHCFVKIFSKIWIKYIISLNDIWYGLHFRHACTSTLQSCSMFFDLFFLILSSFCHCHVWNFVGWIGVTWKAKGVNIWAMTVQNEPLNNASWEACFLVTVSQYVGFGWVSAALIWGRKH